MFFLLFSLVSDIGLVLLDGRKLEVLAALKNLLNLVAADGALKSEDHLLSGFRLLVEHGLGLTTKTSLLAVVTTLTLCVDAVLALLVLSNLVGSVLSALLRGAESVLGLGNGNHLLCVCFFLWQKKLFINLINNFVYLFFLPFFPYVLYSVEKKTCPLIL